MSHAAAHEDVYHRHHHPNHRHAVPLRPILHRRTTASHPGRQQQQGHPQSRVRLSMRRNSDAPRRSEDRYASVIAAVSQAREWIRLHERENENDAQPPARRPRFRTFGIGTVTSEENAINLDPDSEPTHSPQPRHVPGTPHPQHSFPYPHNFEQEQPPPPPPRSFQPASAPQISSVLPATTPPPPVSIPFQNMYTYMDPPTAGQFYQQPQRASPFVLPTPLVPIPGLIATPMATSLTLPSSWAPNTPQMSASYVPSPATPWHQFQPVTPASGTIAWQPYPYPHPGTSPAAFWSTPALVTPSLPPTPLTPGQPIAMSGGLPLPGTQPSWTPVESWPPHEQTLPVHLSPWLAPNPVNPDRPHVIWNVSEAPSKAQRISGKDIFVSMHEAFSSDAIAVFPETDEVVVVCNVGLAQDMWPPIVIRKRKVTSGDVFWAIYQFFQKPITRDEVERIKARSADDYRRLLETCYRRCARTPGLADITRRQGVRRVDCLEDRTAWWGLWPVWAPDGTWSLHLNLTESHRA